MLYVTLSLPTGYYQRLGKTLKQLGIRRCPPFPLDQVLENDGLEAALWALGCTTEDSSRTESLLAADYAERVLGYFEEAVPDDSRPRDAIEAARKFARHEISSDTRSWYYSEAWDAALSAERDRYSPPCKATVAAMCCVEGAQRIALATQFAALEAVALAKGGAAVAAEKRWQEERLREYLAAHPDEPEKPNKEGE